MSEYKWLIFLPHNVTTDEYLKKINAPFNSEIITGKFEKDKVEFEISHRVAEDYPLQVIPHGTFHTDEGLVGLPRNDYIYKRRNDMEGFQVRTATWEVSETQKKKKIK